MADERNIPDEQEAELEPDTGDDEPEFELHGKGSTKGGGSGVSDPPFGGEPV